MAAVFAQLIVALSILTVEGSSHVFRVVDECVQLEINGSVSEFEDFIWTFRGSDNVLKYDKELKRIKPSTRYKDRVEFIEETCSLTLNNLQKTDSGPYEVKASSRDHTTSARYRLSVLDPVEAPVLTHRRSTDPCNITLTCRGHDLSITSTCNNETCEEKEVTSPGGVALSLSVRDGAIICNHSNRASWKQENITFTHIFVHTGTEYMEVHSRSHWPRVLTAVILGILGILVLLFFGYRKIQRRRSADVKQMENSLYAVVERNDQPSSRKAMLETDSNEYCTVKHPASSE